MAVGNEVKEILAGAPEMEVRKRLGLIAQEIVSDPRKLRKVVALLYESDMSSRFLGARLFGEIARIKPELIRNKWRRIFYAFDDTMSCWGVTEGLGEVARNVPELRSRILLLLRKFREDEVSCQGFVWALCRIGQVDRACIASFIPEMKTFLDSRDICMLGQTIWALGELSINEALHGIVRYVDDERETWIYENDSVEKKSLGLIAREAAGKLSPSPGGKTSL